MQSNHDELPQTLASFDPTCYSEKENLLPNFVDNSPNVFNLPPMYSSESCGNDARYGPLCTPKVKEEDRRKRMYRKIQSGYKYRYWKIPICYNDDDNDYSFATQEYLKKFSSAITPDLPKSDSLIMEDEHLNTIPKTESDELIKYSSCGHCHTPGGRMVILKYTVIWRRPKAITPDEPSEEPEDPLIMGEEELSTILEKDKSSVEDHVPIPSGSKGFSEDICDNNHFDAESLLSQDIPITSPKIDILSKEFAGELAPISPGMDEDEFDEEEDDCYDNDTSSDDDSFENIDYVEASPPDSELVSLEEVEDIEPDQGRLISVVISDYSNNPLLELPEFESFHFDPSFPRRPPEPPDVEISLIVETDAPVINNVDELNEDECFDPWGGEIDVEVDDSFTFITRTFLPYLTYPEVSPLLSSTKNEDTIFDPDIST
ncbi:hypothetical protein Tco_1437605 [Tanacetum coccineum]